MDLKEMPGSWTICFKLKFIRVEKVLMWSRLCTTNLNSKSKRWTKDFLSPKSSLSQIHRIAVCMCNRGVTARGNVDRWVIRLVENKDCLTAMKEAVSASIQELIVFITLLRTIRAVKENLQWCIMTIWEVTGTTITLKRGNKAKILVVQSWVELQRSPQATSKFK